jgi:hypothetical protein
MPSPPVCCPLSLADCEPEEEFHPKWSPSFSDPDAPRHRVWSQMQRLICGAHWEFSIKSPTPDELVRNIGEHYVPDDVPQPEVLTHRLDWQASHYLAHPTSARLAAYNISIILLCLYILLAYLSVIIKLVVVVCLGTGIQWRCYCAWNHTSRHLKTEVRASVHRVFNPKWWSPFG